MSNNTKKIQTRIQNKHDVEANWKLATGFKPLPGELIIYDEDENYSYKRFKLGDGETVVNELPFYIIEADNLTFDDDIIITTAIGNIALDDSGSGTIPAKGKNLKQVFEAIFTKEKNPTATQPAVSISTSVTYAEVGAKIIPSYSASLSSGSYTYGVTKEDKQAGRTAGVTADSWTVSFGEQIRTTATGSFDEMTVTEGDCCKVTATASYSDDDATPATNLGNSYPDVQIKAGTASLTKKLVTGYKPNFYGFKTASIDLDSIDSAVIRGLDTNQKQTIKPVTSANCSTSWMQFFYAVPKGRKTTLAAKDSNNLPLTVNSKDITVNHENGVSSTYTVFYINNDAAYGATTLALTWS